MKEKPITLLVGISTLLWQGLFIAYVSIDRFDNNPCVCHECYFSLFLFLLLILQKIFKKEKLFSSSLYYKHYIPYSYFHVFHINKHNLTFMCIDARIHISFVDLYIYIYCKAKKSDHVYIQRQLALLEVKERERNWRGVLLTGMMMILLH
jgi:hypothetical protein